MKPDTKEGKQAVFLTARLPAWPDTAEWKQACFLRRAMHPPAQSSKQTPMYPMIKRKIFSCPMWSESKHMS